MVAKAGVHWLGYLATMSSEAGMGEHSGLRGTVLFTAFEPSGDAHAAPVVKALRGLAPDLFVAAWGGPKLHEAGATVIERSADDGAMGLSALSRMGAVRRHAAAIDRWRSQHRVTVHVPVDSPAANFPIARRFKRSGVRVCHLVAPQLWAWGAWRLNKLRRCTDCVLCLLPFEEKWFRDRQISAKFIGHPVINRVIDRAVVGERAVQLPPGAPKILLLPGSRSSEVWRNTPLLIRTLDELRARHRGLNAVLVAANDELLQLVRRRMGSTVSQSLSLIVGDLDSAIAWCDLALCVSGTVSLDLTRQAKPMVGVYQASMLSCLGARMFLKTPNRLLPNILAGERIVPEFVPYSGGAAPVFEAAQHLLSDSSRMRLATDGLRQVLESFRGHDPAIEAAQAILSLVRGENPLAVKPA